MDRRRAAFLLAGFGRMSAMLADRVQSAADPYRAGRVQRILVSGVLLGPAHPSGGNGRSSWGPADPLAPGSP